MDVCEVHAGYGRHQVLRGVTWCFAAGKVTALRGSNGAGKTTLLDVMAGISSPDRGHVVRPPGGVAYVPQRTHIDPRLPLTVRDVVTMGAWQRRGAWRRVTRDDRRAVEGAMDDLGIAPLARRRLDELSGGQIQRSLVARAIVCDAPVMVLDEPMSGLDIGVRRELSEVLRRVAATGRVVVQATHDAEAAEASDEIVVLVDGRLRPHPPTRDQREQARARFA
ncbi:hypothetical protein BHE97_16560 [Aeromicrobium sp. PE09-221]|nr:hypothetical protein BHE97_16560 [Aeromicrobium sp. PE09-221]